MCKIAINLQIKENADNFNDIMLQTRGVRYNFKFGMVEIQISILLARQVPPKYDKKNNKYKKKWNN